MPIALEPGSPIICLMVDARLRLALLWVLLALFPLRGWATGLMATDGWPAGPAVSAQVSAPCHGAHAASEEQQEPMATEAGAVVSAFCGDCDLCHAPMAITGGPALARLVPSDALPEGHPRDTGRLIASWLERPPRP